MDRRRTDGSREIDDYLAGVSPMMRVALQQLRKTIRSAAPDAEEVISYGIPAFRQNGDLVHFAAFKDHCSFFAGHTTTLPKFAREVEPFLSGKTTLRFTPERPIPATLVKRLVRERLRERGPTHRS
jgi:uncharacterized protein YdhG (YjbR/CyaY superfamily)